jgi:hypothetical protein
MISDMHETPAGNTPGLSAEEIQALEAPQAQDAVAGGGVATVQILLEVEGFGSFTAGAINTLNGINSPWVGAGVTLPLNATPAPGWRFSHWVLNGLFGGASLKHYVYARIGLKVKAVFVPAA